MPVGHRREHHQRRRPPAPPRAGDRRAPSRRSGRAPGPARRPAPRRGGPGPSRGRAARRRRRPSRTLRVQAHSPSIDTAYQRPSTSASPSGKVRRRPETHPRTSRVAQRTWAEPARDRPTTRLVTSAGPRRSRGRRGTWRAAAGPARSLHQPTRRAFHQHGRAADPCDRSSTAAAPRSQRPGCHRAVVASTHGTDLPPRSHLLDRHRAARPRRRPGRSTAACSAGSSPSRHRPTRRRATSSRPSTASTSRPSPRPRAVGGVEHLRRGRRRRRRRRARHVAGRDGGVATGRCRPRWPRRRPARPRGQSRSGCGRRAGARAPSSSTPPAPGTSATCTPPTSAAAQRFYGELFRLALRRPGVGHRHQRPRLRRPPRGHRRPRHPHPPGRGARGLRGRHRQHRAGRSTRRPAGRSS